MVVRNDLVNSENIGMVVGVSNVVDSAVLVDDVKSGIVVGDVVVVLSDTSEEVKDIEETVVV